MAGTSAAERRCRCKKSSLERRHYSHIQQQFYHHQQQKWQRQQHRHDLHLVHHHQWQAQQQYDVVGTYGNSDVEVDSDSDSDVELTAMAMATYTITCISTAWRSGVAPLCNKSSSNSMDVRGRPIIISISIAAGFCSNVRRCRLLQQQVLGLVLVLQWWSGLERNRAVVVERNGHRS